MVFGFGVDEAGKVDDGKMRAVRAGHLDAEDVLGKGPAVVAGDAHLKLCSLNQLGEMVEVVKLLAEGQKIFALGLGTGAMGDDGNGGADVGSPAQDQLGREASAKVALDGEENARDRLEDGALAGRLVAADDDLREGDVVVDALQAELVNRVKEDELVLGAELAQGVGGEGDHLERAAKDG